MARVSTSKQLGPVPVIDHTYRAEPARIAPMTRGEFEAAREKRDDQPFAPDWLVTEVIDRGAGVYYRFHVRGENLNFLPGDREREFSWSVPALDWRYFMAAEAVQVA